MWASDVKNDKVESESELMDSLKNDIEELKSEFKKLEREVKAQDTLLFSLSTVVMKNVLMDKNKNSGKGIFGFMSKN